MGEGFWQGRRRLLKWLLVEMSHLEPMAMAAYYVPVVQAGADEVKDQSRGRLDPERRERPPWEGAPNLGPITVADFPMQVGTRPAPAHVEVL